MELHLVGILLLLLALRELAGEVPGVLVGGEDRGVAVEEVVRLRDGGDPLVQLRQRHAQRVVQVHQQPQLPTIILKMCFECLTDFETHGLDNGYFILCACQIFWR